jgi:hypothetical protein
LFISLVGAARFELATPSSPGSGYRRNQLIYTDKCFASSLGEPQISLPFAKTIAALGGRGEGPAFRTPPP